MCSTNVILYKKLYYLAFGLTNLSFGPIASATILQM